ncbi:MAG: histidine kinase [Chitinophagaceae bacterium]|nr:histidine kinase [Chitinophagaceae bacterium]
MFSHRYRYLFILALGLYSYLNTLFTETFRYYNIKEPHPYIISAFVSVCLLVWEGNRFTERLLGNRLYRQQYKIHPLLVFFSMSQLVALCAASLTYFIVGKWWIGKTGDEALVGAKLIFLFTFRINLFLHCINTIVFFLKRYKQKQLEAEELRRISAQAQLQAVKSRINPHFLFNNLNVLSTLILQKNQDANTFIEQFSAVYRYILRNQDAELVRLKDELEFIKPYLYLLEKRFGENVNVILDIPANYAESHIVPVALQMLVENAIKHNIASSKKPLAIKIYVNADDYLVVHNNFQPKTEKEPGTQTGLYNINQRFRLITGREIIVHRNNISFTVSVPLIKNELV